MNTAVKIKQFEDFIINVSNDKVKRKELSIIYKALKSTAKASEIATFQIEYLPDENNKRVLYNISKNGMISYLINRGDVILAST